MTRARGLVVDPRPLPAYRLSRPPSVVLTIGLGAYRSIGGPRQIGTNALGAGPLNALGLSAMAGDESAEEEDAHRVVSEKRGGLVDQPRSQLLLGLVAAPDRRLQVALSQQVGGQLVGVEGNLVVVAFPAGVTPLSQVSRGTPRSVPWGEG